MILEEPPEPLPPWSEVKVKFNPDHKIGETKERIASIAVSKAAVAMEKEKQQFVKQYGAMDVYLFEQKKQQDKRRFKEAMAAYSAEQIKEQYGTQWEAMGAYLLQQDHATPQSNR